MRIPTHAGNAGTYSVPQGAKPPEPAPVLPPPPAFRCNPVCLLLAIGYAAAVAFFPPPQFSKGPELAGFIIGAAIVGLLVPMVVAYLAYRVSGRSSGVANFAFGFLVALVLGGSLFRMTKTGGEMASKLETRIRSEIDAKPVAAAIPAVDAAGNPTVQRPAVKGSPEIRVYRRSAAASESDKH